MKVLQRILANNSSAVEEEKDKCIRNVQREIDHYASKIQKYRNRKRNVEKFLFPEESDDSADSDFDNCSDASY